MFHSPGSIAVQIGPLAIHWYGIMIGIGIIGAYLYIVRESRRRGLDFKHFDAMIFWVIAAGIVGARLYYVLFNFSYYSARPAEILQIWRGGLAIHGALLGGALAFFIYVWRHKIAWRLYLDVMLPGVLLAQAIGRWGNFFNNEAFGRPTNLPWKLFIPQQFRPAQFIDSAYFHPTFLYESLWDFLGFIILMTLSKKLYPHTKRSPGYILCGYLVWYSLGRFFIEGLRTDSLYIGSFRTAQVMSVILFFTGIFGLLYLHFRKDRSGR